MMHSFTPHQHLDERGRREDRMDGRMSQGGWGGAPIKGKKGRHWIGDGGDGVGGVCGMSICHEFSPSPTALNAHGLLGNGNATMATHVV